MISGDNSTDLKADICLKLCGLFLAEQITDDCQSEVDRRSHCLARDYVAAGYDLFVIGDKGAAHVSRVKTLMSSGCVVSVNALTSDVSGMAKGDYSLVEKGFFRVTEIPEDAELVEGEIVVTRGDGKLYPASLPVGRIVRIEKNALNRTVEAVCSPFVDMSFDSDSDVMVITGFETRDTETETQAQAEDE